MGAFKIFSRFAQLLDIKVSRAAAAWLRLNADGTVSERTAGETLGDLGGISATGGTMTNGTISGHLTVNSTSYTFGTGAAVAFFAELVNGNESTARTALGAGTVGDALFTATTIQQAQKRTIKKLESDKSYTTTLLSTVSELSIPIEANKKYLWRGKLIFTSAVATAGWKFELAFPTIIEDFATGNAIGYVTSAVATVVIALLTTERSQSQSYTSAAATRAYLFEAIIECSASGDSTVKVAQSTADAVNPSLLRAGSWTSIEPFEE